MNTFSQGKDTFFINTINISSSLMDELKIGVEFEKRKKEAEQAILKKKHLEILKKEEEEAAKRLSVLKKNNSELVVAATNLLEEILKSYENDLFDLNSSLKKIDIEGRLVKGYVDGQEVIVDLESQSIYKFEYFEKITANDIIKRLDNIAAKESLFNIISKRSFESPSFVNRAFEITTICNYIIAI